MSQYTFKDFYEFDSEKLNTKLDIKLNVGAIMFKIMVSMVIMLLLLTGFLFITFKTVTINRYDLTKTYIKYQDTLKIWKTK